MQKLFISIHDHSKGKAIGACLIDIPDGVDAEGPFDVRARLSDPEGEDVKDMEPNIFHTRKMLEERDYASTHAKPIKG